MTNEEKAKEIAWNLFDDGLCFHKYEYQRQEIQSAILKMAKWKDEQYEQNRLKHSENITKEEYDREVAFSDWFFSQGFNRQPTFSDAIEWGRKQMIEKACE